MNCIEIRAADNGFVLTYQDPVIVEQNANSDGWKNPDRSRVYNDAAALLKDLGEMLPLLKKADEAMSEAQEYRGTLQKLFGDD